MSKRRKIINFIVEVSIFTALGLVLDILGGALFDLVWPNGGSVSLAMICIFIVAYRRGLAGGLLTGLLVGTIQILWAGAGNIVHPFQAMLDYTFAYMSAGLAGIVRKQVMVPNWKQTLFISLSIVVCCLVRLMCHTLSGILYWGSTFTASVLYNGTFILTTIVVCCIITSIIMRNKFFTNVKN